MLNAVGEIALLKILRSHVRHHPASFAGSRRLASRRRFSMRPGMLSAQRSDARPKCHQCPPPIATGRRVCAVVSQVPWSCSIIKIFDPDPAWWYDRTMRPNFLHGLRWQKSKREANTSDACTQATHSRCNVHVLLHNSVAHLYRCVLVTEVQSGPRQLQLRQPHRTSRPHLDSCRI
ncbi:hypothetical protein B0T11DRAFT_283678 [Plectosphaerella cucumerina]|uniref:Uncharacterized protein n=1 Tax=Plectosphaerella cucumerina TaxID=40658 RepID=A0A8K0TAN0_9PEZI|nr:hypothetical protein B0T11DRAFT_283678 [Plectosphaerella cucumerina]